MKSIKKLKESSKAVAGTALLVGATLAGGAAFATAANHNMGGSSGSSDLGDYPHPFVDDEGAIASTIVMGEDAKATDVVAAADIAGQLGNDAFSTESVSAGSGSFGWSASNGATLDTRNDQLYFGNSIDTVRQTLTSDHLDALADYDFQDDGGDDTEVEFYLYPGTQDVDYTQDDADDEDPTLKVNNPADPTSQSTSLYTLQANFEDGLAFNSSDVEGEEIELFGKTFTIGDDNTASELTLYGNQEEVSINSGSSSTITVNGQETTIEVVGVTSSNTAAFRVDGNLRQKDDGQTFSVNGEDVRLTDVIQTNSQNSEGVVTFATGSEELVLNNGNVEDGDGDEFEGVSYSVTSDFSDASSIEFYVGAEDDDMTFVEAGDSYSHSLFENIRFSFGGLNPDSSEEGESVGQIEFSSNGDDTAVVDFEDGEDSASLEFGYASNLDAGDGTSYVGLQDSDGDSYATLVGENVAEDGYMTVDQGDFDHMFEVTNIDPEEQDPQDGDEEATVDLRDVVTGNTVEVDVDVEDTNGLDSNDPDYVGTEVVDGQTYQFSVETGTTADSSDDRISVSYQDGNYYIAPAVDTDSGAALTFLDGSGYTDIFSTDLTVNASASTGNSFTETVVVPSTESTGTQSIEATVTDDAGTSTVSYDVAGATGTYDTSTSSGEVVQTTVERGGMSYQVTLDADNQHGDAANSEEDITFSMDVTPQTAAGGTVPAGATSVVIQPEEDTMSGDVEKAYHLTPGLDDSDDEVDISTGQAVVQFTGTGAAYSGETMESNDDVSADYNNYGTYSELDSDQQGTFTLNIPNGQATAGAAFTGADGDLSGSASGAGTVETMTPTGWSSSDVALDSDNTVSSAKQDSNLILVGGPAANSLVSELVEANKTMPTSDYTEGQGMLQLVEDAFTEGHDALVVAGYTGEDTRQAGSFLTSYEANSEALEGSSEVTINTAEGSVVQ